MKFNRPFVELSGTDAQIAASRNWPTQLNVQFSVSSGTFTNNSPGAGSVAWANCIVEHNRQQYRITDGNSSNKFVYWSLASPTAFSTAATIPTITENLFIVGVNDTGTFTQAWKSGQGVQSVLIVGTVIADQVTAGAIDGMTITGATLRTAASGQRVEINSTDGLKGIAADSMIATQVDTDGMLYGTQLRMHPDRGSGQTVTIGAATDRYANLLISTAPDGTYTDNESRIDLWHLSHIIRFLIKSNIVATVEEGSLTLTSGNVLKVGSDQVVGARGATITDPAGGGTVDSEARTAINAIIDRLQAHGLIA
jgi:hypothetical protein